MYEEEVKWERGINTPDAQSLLILSKLYNVTAKKIYVIFGMIYL